MDTMTKTYNNLSFAKSVPDLQVLGGSDIAIRQTLTSVPPVEERIRVIVRVRPLAGIDKESQLAAGIYGNRIVIDDGNAIRVETEFNEVLGMATSQETVFERV